MSAKADDDDKRVVSGGSLDPAIAARNRKLIFMLPKAEFDFGAVAKEVGYVKARQLRRQFVSQQHQKEVENKDEENAAAKAPLRLKEAIRISATLGGPSNQSAIEKIMENSKRDAVVVGNQTPQEAQKEFDAETAVRLALLSDKNDLQLAQFHLDRLPLFLGETLCAQTGFLQSLSCPGNNFLSMISSDMPQFSIYQLRYLKELNLAHNKIKFLPPDFGVMSLLRKVNLSDNRLSTLPKSFTRLTALTDLDLSKNSFHDISDDLGNAVSLRRLVLSDNVFNCLPIALLRLRNLKSLEMSGNVVVQMGMLPLLMKPEEVWKRVIDQETQSFKYYNVLTREKVHQNEVKNYSWASVDQDCELQVFQPEGTLPYQRRKVWLAINQVHEWEPIEDLSTASIYYRNNVSGETQWEIPLLIDCIGQLGKLEVFTMNNNNLKAMAQSISRMTNLTKLTLFGNRIHDLPNEFGKLKKLEYFDFHGNELSQLPQSFMNCTSLRYLNLSGNALVRLPDLLGTLPQLANLNVSANRLTQLPLSLGYAKGLNDLVVEDNPLVDPPIEETIKGLEHFKWYMRSRLQINNRGLPPAMRYADRGIMNEITVLLPEVSLHLRRLIDRSEGSGFLNLTLMGLRDLPLIVMKMKNLKRLRLDFNDQLKLSSGLFPKNEMQDLKAMSLKACRLTSIPDSIRHLKSLTQLNMEDNCLTELPDAFVRLKNLTHLDISRNRLYNLPEDIEQLSNLKRLILEGNRLEFLPDTIGKLDTLEWLNVSQNLVCDLPDAVCGLTNLKKLNLETNRLSSLPSRMSDMSIIDLRVGHNRIEHLDDELFSSSLGQSIKMFRCSENTMQELPSSLCFVDPHAGIEAEFLPLISPPQYLVTEGIAAMQPYMKIRRQRQAEIEQMMLDQDFDFVIERSYPVACDVLEDGTGFLTPTDLASFDRAVHEVLNGEYFRCPSSSKEVVDRIVKLRDDRENEMYLGILNGLIDTLEEATKDNEKRYGPAVLTKVKRPWGNQGEPANCWAISLNCLLTDSPPSIYHRNGRPALIKTLQGKIPPSPFPFSIELLKDSLRLFYSPYGQVADTEPVKYDKCDCVQLDPDLQDPGLVAEFQQSGKDAMPKYDFKPCRHHLPCEKTAVVLCCVMWLPEEAERREREEAQIFERFEDIELDIRAWLETRSGLDELNKEIARRKVANSGGIKLREDMTSAQQLLLKEAAFNKAGVVRRLKMFDAKAPYSTHGFRERSDGEAVLKEFEAEIAKYERRISNMAKAMARMKADMKLSMSERRERAINELLQKYSSIAYKEMLIPFRQYAADSNRRRPWDGPDGLWYNEWRRTYRGKVFRKGHTDDGQTIYTADSMATASEGIAGLLSIANKRPQSAAGKDMGKARQEQEEARDAVVAPDTGDVLLPPEYNWQGTEKMAKYECALYNRYVTIRVWP